MVEEDIIQGVGQIQVCDCGSNTGDERRGPPVPSPPSSLAPSSPPSSPVMVMEEVRMKEWRRISSFDGFMLTSS